MKLALFFTRGISLKQWNVSGLLDREKLLYEEHLKKGNLEVVYWLTYGSDDRKEYQKLIAEKKLHFNIKLLEMPEIFNSWIGKMIYSFLLPILHWKALIHVDLLKTNQIDGCWSAVIAKMFYGKKLILRTGYILTQLRKKLPAQTLKESIKIWVYSLIERGAYCFADICFVTSMHGKTYLEKNYPCCKDKIKIIRNYVDTSSFYPMIGVTKYSDRILFIGRLMPIKNIFNLIRAISTLDVILDVYGEGELKSELVSFSKKINSKVNFHGVIPNSELPNLMNKYRYFIIPSYFDSMPKTLLEALSCGLICIGTNVKGINEIIEDQINGFLIPSPDTQDIKMAIESVMKLELVGLKKNARETILKNFSLETIIELEKKIFELLGE